MSRYLCLCTKLYISHLSVITCIVYGFALNIYIIISATKPLTRTPSTIRTTTERKRAQTSTRSRSRHFYLRLFIGLETLAAMVTLFADFPR